MNRPTKFLFTPAMGVGAMATRTGYLTEDAAVRLMERPASREGPAGDCAESNPRPSDLSTSLILLAEDDLDTRDFLTLFLRKSGFRVLSVADGEEAVRALDSHRPDLFILDCQMPGRTGLEVCQTVRQLRDHADTPVIFLTALTDPDSRLRGFAAGAADYVTKPVERVELLARIKTHLELSASRRLLRARAASLGTTAVPRNAEPQAEGQSSTAFPTSPVDYPDIKLGVRRQAERTTGGVFHEVKRLRDGEYGLLVADANLCRLAAPYLTGVLKALCAVFLQDSLAPAETLRLMNAHLPDLMGHEGRITACYARYSRSRMTVDLATAGQAPTICHRPGQSPQFTMLAGDPLGTVGQPAWESTQLQVNSGDRLFLCTHGLLPRIARPGMDVDPAALGDRIARRIERCGWQPIDQTLDVLVEQALQEANGSPVDDFVVLALEC